VHGLEVGRIKQPNYELVRSAIVLTCQRQVSSLDHTPRFPQPGILQIQFVILGG
jgi:hypothetical protein